MTALQKYKSINIYTKHSDIELCDVILSSSDLIPVEYENKVYIFGPHFSVFPDTRFVSYVNTWKKNMIFNLLSEWCINLWTYKIDDKCIADKVINIPFGVDTGRFNEIIPASQRHNVFVYYKRRDPIELNCVQNFLNKKNIQYRVFNYDTKYNEEDYLQYLQTCKYGVILDAHESQGFAIEEALSCNVPLLVWNVKTMQQEYRSNYPNYSATSIPYWDERCGEYFYDTNDMEKTFDKFISKLDTYKPREFILENLSMEKCEEKLIDLINTIKSKM